jgi:hypothetical protein
MAADRHTRAFRMYAELPSGKQLVPGDALSCSGPGPLPIPLD